MDVRGRDHQPVGADPGRVADAPGREPMQVRGDLRQIGDDEREPLAGPVLEQQGARVQVDAIAHGAAALRAVAREPDAGRWRDVSAAESGAEARGRHRPRRRVTRQRHLVVPDAPGRHERNSQHDRRADGHHETIRGDSRNASAAHSLALRRTSLGLALDGRVESSVLNCTCPSTRNTVGTCTG